jgi:hypothetical protein
VPRGARRPYSEAKHGLTICGCPLSSPSPQLAARAITVVRLGLARSSGLILGPERSCRVGKTRADRRDEHLTSTAIELVAEQHCMLQAMRRNQRIQFSLEVLREGLIPDFLPIARIVSRRAIAPHFHC